MQIHTTRILVTGGAGFIGAHLVTRLLGAGATVAVIHNLSTGSHANLAACRDAGLLWRNVFIHDIRDHLYAILYGLRAITLELGNIYGTRLDSQPCADIHPRHRDRDAHRPPRGHPWRRPPDTRLRARRDAAEALRLACFAPLPSSPPTVNIGSGVATPINDVVDLLEAHVPNHLPRQYVPALPYEVTTTAWTTGPPPTSLAGKPSIDLPTGIAASSPN